MTDILEIYDIIWKNGKKLSSYEIKVILDECKKSDDLKQIVKLIKYFWECKIFVKTEIP